VADYGSFHQFLSRFVAPLVLGGRVEVDGLVGPAVLNTWLRPVDADAALITRLAEAARRRLAHVAPMGTLYELPVDVLALCAVWHNLFAMTHPEVHSKISLRRTVRRWCVSFLEWAREPFTRAEVAVRHGALARLSQLGRVDTHVTFWAGYADFVGVAPPPSLLALRDVRRVREVKTRVGLFELLASLDGSDSGDELDDLSSVARATLALSPLTDLSLADRPAPFTFAWNPINVNAIADNALRGAAQRILLARGVAAVRAVEQATLTLARTEVSPPVARLLLRFHLELAVIDAMSSRGGAIELRAPGAATGAAPAVSQALAYDAYAALGHARVAREVGIAEDLVQRALPIDPNRHASKDPLSLPLLQRAGALEVRT
jgi:hypothetical protein